MSAGGSSAKKWMPSTIASVLSTYCSPRRPAISATSSRNFKPPGSASGAKKRAMRPNSPSGFAATGSPHLLGPQVAGNLVEYAVDHAGLLAGVEGVRDVDIFVDCDLWRHVSAMRQFVGADAQNSAQHRL